MLHDNITATVLTTAKIWSWVPERLNAKMDGWMDGWVGGWTDIKTDWLTNRLTDHQSQSNLDSGILHDGKVHYKRIGFKW